ncbi:F-box/WD repeat-containing protein 5 [Orchesella cincta]|uniref:F-box/WD repeat-containing protein 5 n=1 Tax=Orchesella cincta TaxID=48709 RepID=A0A1D2MDL9_ORCCI|nr:F-box/WD repeat-containing protein 5 [Orchesella cincta]
MEELPDSLLLQIFDYLDYKDVTSVSKTCRQLARVANDEILWRNLFHRHFVISPNKFVNPLSGDSWRTEFVRLIDEVPIVETEVVTKHTDQVLHVAFSHDGKRFATTAKDGYVYVWRSGYPVKLEYSQNMKTFSWKYTQFSQFNESDSLLLVSGVLFGLHSTSGEIAIFSLKDNFELQCRTMSKPYDIFGSWYSEMFFLSGNLHWLGQMVSKSVIWLNKASQEAESEHASVMNELYRFYNPKASSVRSLMVANCVEVENPPNGESSRSAANKKQTDQTKSSQSLDSRDIRTGNPLSNLPLERELMDREGPSSQRSLQGGFQSWKPFENVSDINYSDGYCSERSPGQSSSRASLQSPSDLDSTDNSIEEPYESTSQMDKEHLSCLGGTPAKRPKSQKQHGDQRDASPSKCSIEDESEDDFLDPRPKWLIFTCGSKTYTPHQLGFKKINPMTFNGKIDPGPTLKERIEEYKRRKQLERTGEQDPSINWSDHARVAHRFDEVDKIIDLHGHVIGMALSPDHRYLYVNSRPWPEGYRISSELDPPPIAQEIDLHIIDLTTLTQVGMMRRAHRAYTPNDECFFIFLDASDLYLASGAEDKHGYIWDRHYGISLAKIPHKDVVNSVAFNPNEPEMLITVSDDMTIKIWRSRNLCRRLQINTEKLRFGTTLYNVPKGTA